jgi:hypothetical protein
MTSIGSCKAIHSIRSVPSASGGVHPFVAHPSSPARICVGGFRIWETMEPITPMPTTAGPSHTREASGCWLAPAALSRERSGDKQW